MRISDLSRLTGVSIPTIRFYLREGLLPPGQPTGRNQADYDEKHVRQVLFIRALTTIGRLDLASVRDLLAALDDPQLPLPDLYEAVNRVLVPPDGAIADPTELDQARSEVDRFVAGRGWLIQPDIPARDRFAAVLAALHRLGCEFGVDFFVPFADAAERLAVQELDLLPAGTTDPDRAAVVVRAVLLEVALGAIRRMAQEHIVRQRLG